MPKSKHRPNVLCFVTDQLRYNHLGCIGNTEIETPNIDALADVGVLFKRYFTNNTVCQPSRASMITGQSIRGHGRRYGGTALTPSIVTLPEVLSDRGYRTHAAGKLHLHSWMYPNEGNPEDLNARDWPELGPLWDSGKMESLPSPYYGFQTTDFVGGHGYYLWGEYVNWLRESHPDAVPLLSKEHPANTFRNAQQCYTWSLPQELHYNRWIADRSISFIREVADSEYPFFLWCSFPDPHHPFISPEPWAGMYNPDEVSLGPRRDGEFDILPPFYKKAFENKEPIISPLGSVSDREFREIIALTYGMVSHVDQEVGRVMQTLAELGLVEDTIVFFLSDHGDMLSDHRLLYKGPYQFRGAIQVPFICSWKGHLAADTETEGLSSHIDLAPTILDLCDIPLHSDTRVRFEGMVDYDNPPPPLPGKSLRPQLEGRADKVHDYVIHETDMDANGLRIRTFITERYRFTVYPGKPWGELFDLLEDPDELYNLWDSPDYQELKDDLYREFLEAYILQEPAVPKVMHTEKILGQHYWS